MQKHQQHLLIGLVLILAIQISMGQNMTEQVWIGQNMTGNYSFDISGVQNCTFGNITQYSSSYISYSNINHLSEDRNSVYQTSADDDAEHKLFGYKVKMANPNKPGSTIIQQFSTPISVSFHIVYVSINGGCVLVDDGAQLMAYKTSGYTFTSIQTISYTAPYKNLRTSEDCNIVQMIDTSNNLQIYIGSSLYSGAMPASDTVFDTSFKYGLDSSNVLYKYDGAAFTTFQTFTDSENLDIPIQVIDKPGTSMVILYSTNAAGDYALVIYDYQTMTKVIQQKWLSSGVTGVGQLNVQDGNSFISLVFKDQNGLIYAVTNTGTQMKQLSLYDPSTQNSMFSGGALITFSGKQIHTFVNNQINVFDVFANEIFFLGKYDADVVTMANGITIPYSLYKNKMKYLVLSGAKTCYGNNVPVDNSTNSTGGNNFTNQTNNTEGNNTNYSNQTNTTQNNSTNYSNQTSNFTNNETINNQTNNETINNQTNNETINNQTNNETINNQTNNETINNQTNNETINNQTNNETINNQTNNETINNQTNNETINNQTNNETINNQTNNETINNQTNNETINNQTNNETINNQTNNETINNQTNNETINNQTNNETINNETINNQTNNETIKNQTNNETINNQTNNETANNQTTNNETNNQTNPETNNQTTNSTTNQTTNSTSITNSTANSTDNSTNNNTTPTDENITFAQDNNIVDIINSNNGRGFHCVSTQSIAVSCTGACLNCSSETNGVITCTTCYNCTLGYTLKENGRCGKCKGGCRTCSSSDRSKCLTCYDNQNLDSATNTCVTNTCNSNLCKNCNGAGECTSCYESYSLHSGACITCIEGCGACTSSQLECDVGGCLNSYVFLTNTITSINECVICGVGCLSCQNTDLTNCLTCKQGFFATPNITSTVGANICSVCISNCITCSDSTTCTTCTDGYFVGTPNTKCVLQCSSLCYTCAQNLPNNCTSCTAEYVYDSVLNTCTPSLTCNDTASCISCPASYTVDNGFCYLCELTDTNCASCQYPDITACQVCNSAYYLDSTSTPFLCKSCSENCTFCFDSSICTQCKDTSFLVTRRGKSLGYCHACQSPCVTCQNKADICKTCISGYTLQGKRCRSPIYVHWRIQVQIDRTMWAMIFNFFRTKFIQTCSNVETTTQSDVYYDQIDDGSTVVGGTVNGGSTTAAGIGSAIQTAFPPGGNIQGFTTMASATSVNGLSITKASSSNLGLILGISIPLLILFILVVIYFIYKSKTDEKEVQSTSQVVKESQNNIYPSEGGYTDQI